MVNERGTGNGRYNLRPREGVGETVSSTPRNPRPPRRRNVRKRGGSGMGGGVEVSWVGWSTPRKRGSQAAEMGEADPSGKRRQRSPEPLPPPTPLSEPQQPTTVVQETTNDSGTPPQFSGLVAGGFETPNFPTQRDTVPSESPQQYFDSSTQTDAIFITPPYYPQVSPVQEPYIPRNLNEANLPALDPSVGSLYDASFANNGGQAVFPVVPSILPIEGTSMAMVHTAPVDLAVPFQYQGSSERLHHYRPADSSQFDFARNLQQSIPTEPSQTNTLNLLAGVVNDIIEQQVDFPGLPFDQQFIQQPIEEHPLDLTQIVGNLFLGSSSVYLPENFDRFCALGITRIFTIRKEEEIVEAWDRAAMQALDNDGRFLRHKADVSDAPSANLLHCFDNLCTEIHLYLTNGFRVFVHCETGRTSSAAVIMAYLMKSERLTFDQAHERVREIRQQIEINPGFIRQLRVWEVIKDDFPNRRTYPEYKLWKMSFHNKVIAGNDHLGLWSITSVDRKIPIKRDMFKFNQDFPVTFTADIPNGIPQIRFPHLIQPEASYIRCVNCKYPLAPGSTIVSFSDVHNPFGTKCSHFFLCNAMSWMKFDSSSPGGKIYCPNQECGKWLGEYCFLGVQCDCGEISSPGIALLRRAPGTQAARTEFMRVHEEGDDVDSVSSSNGEEDFDNDEIDEENYAEGDDGGGGGGDDDDGDDDDGEEEDREREEDEENTFQRDHWAPPEAEQQNVYLATSTIPISSPNDRLARPSSTAPTTAQIQLIQRQLFNASRSPFQPPNSNVFPSPRPPNPHHLPARPSRLRVAFIPRSTPSSTTSSQNGNSDDEGGLQTIGEQEEPAFDLNEFLVENPDFAAALHGK